MRITHRRQEILGELPDMKTFSTLGKLRRTSGSLKCTTRAMRRYATIYASIYASIVMCRSRDWRSAGTGDIGDVGVTCGEERGWIERRAAKAMTVFRKSNLNAIQTYKLRENS